MIPEHQGKLKFKPLSHRPSLLHELVEAQLLAVRIEWIINSSISITIGKTIFADADFRYC